MYLYGRVERHFWWVNEYARARDLRRDGCGGGVAGALPALNTSLLQKLAECVWFSISNQE